MRIFNFEDKKQGVRYKGICPNNDENCPPFDYFRYSHAEIQFRVFNDKLKLKCPVSFPEHIVRDFVLSEVDNMINEKMDSTKPNLAISKLLIDNDLSKKEQSALLKGVTLNADEFLWLNKEAQELGYLLNIYHVEITPEKFNERNMPMCYHHKEDNTIDKIGSTDMSDGELRALLEQRKVLQARLYHKDEQWHCFFFTFKGLSGLESGILGSQPHWHYLSDKNGIVLAKIKECIANGNMATSSVHILIKR